MLRVTSALIAGFFLALMLIVSAQPFRSYGQKLVTG